MRHEGHDYTLSQPLDEANLRVVSLGAGVQSSVMALATMHQLIGPMPDAAIFADTQWEPAQVYEHLNWLESVLPFPVHRVTAGDIRAQSVEARTAASGAYEGRWVAMPWYTLSPEGSQGMVRRQCTKEFKLEPIRRGVRELLGIAPRDPVSTIKVEQWIGISTDEIGRCKDSGARYITNRWPLIELGWNRRNCQAWFDRHYPGRPLPSSACIGCPYRRDSSWREMQRDRPEEFEDACDFDERIRNAAGMKGESFTHSSLKPLREAINGEHLTQGDFGFDQECDGMCGV